MFLYTVHCTLHTALHTATVQNILYLYIRVVSDLPTIMSCERYKLCLSQPQQQHTENAWIFTVQYTMHRKAQIIVKRHRFTDELVKIQDLLGAMYQVIQNSKQVPTECLPA